MSKIRARDEAGGVRAGAEARDRASVWRARTKAENKARVRENARAEYKIGSESDPVSEEQGSRSRAGPKPVREPEPGKHSETEPMPVTHTGITRFACSQCRKACASRSVSVMHKRTLTEKQTFA